MSCSTVGMAGAEGGAVAVFDVAVGSFCSAVMFNPNSGLVL